MTDSVFKTVEAPVKKAVVMICEKCGAKLSPEGTNLSREIQQTLKAEIKGRLGKGVIRAVVTSCLDLCPEGKITVAINHLEENKTEFLEADPENPRAVIDGIFERALS